MELLITLTSLGPASMFGQSIVTGGISGIVTDPSEAVIPNVALTLRNGNTGEASTTMSAASGAYVEAARVGSLVMTTGRPETSPKGRIQSSGEGGHADMNAKEEMWSSSRKSP